MPEVPDIDGFREAQRRLVQYLGTPVTFHFASTYGYASGVYVDPETGTALDPLQAPSAIVVPPTITANATKINSFPSSEEQGVSQKMGIAENSRVWLRLNEGDYPSGVVGARAFVVHGETFRIDRVTYDGIGSSAVASGVPGVDRVYFEGELTESLSTAIGPGIPSGGVIGTTGAIVREDFNVASGQTAFNTSTAYAAGTPRVYMDGLLQRPGSGEDYTEGGGTLITLEYTPFAGQLVTIIYQLP